MNRAQRRRLMKKGEIVPAKEPVYNVKQSDLKAFKKKAVDDAVSQAADAAMVLLLSLPIKILKRDYGWGNKRLPEFAEKLTDEYQSFVDGEVSLEEYADLVYQYTGIKFAREGDPEYEQEEHNGDK